MFIYNLRKGFIMAIKVTVSPDGKTMTIVCDIVKELSTSELNYKVVESGGFARVVKGNDGKPILVHGQPLSLAINATVPNDAMPEVVRNAKKTQMKLTMARAAAAKAEAAAVAAAEAEAEANKSNKA
jgi:hypothetical protein